MISKVILLLIFNCKSEIIIRYLIIRDKVHKFNDKQLGRLKVNKGEDEH